MSVVRKLISARVLNATFSPLAERGSAIENVIRDAPACFAKTKRSPGSGTICASVPRGLSPRKSFAANRVSVTTGKKDVEFVSPP